VVKQKSNENKKMDFLDNKRVINRSDLLRSKRILVKVGTSTVIQSDNTAALGRVGELVEQLSILHHWSKEVVLVASGSVGLGAHTVKQNRAQLLANNVSQSVYEPHIEKRVAAAMGQSRLMMLYEVMFAQKGITCSQILVTNEDFRNESKRNNLRWTINSLLNLGFIPILNENDVTSTLGDRNDLFNDNDSLACLVGADIGADAVLLLTDVEGLYIQPPTPENPKPDVIHTFVANHTHFTIGAKSSLGRGGMQSKVDAALLALENNVPAVIIASGYTPNTITRAIRGETVGTLFVKNPVEVETLHQNVESMPHRLMAKL